MYEFVIEDIYNIINLKYKNNRIFSIQKKKNTRQIILSCFCKNILFEREKSVKKWKDIQTGDSYNFILVDIYLTTCDYKFTE